MRYKDINSLWLIVARFQGVGMKCPIDGEILKADKAKIHIGYGCS